MQVFSVATRESELEDGMSSNSCKLTTPNQPMYRYWQALYMSFYSQRIYVDVARRWRGLGAMYLLFVLAVAAIPLSLYLIIEFTRFFNEAMILPFQRLPPFYIQNGEVAFDKPMPYFVKNDKREVVAIIDTTGEITTLPDTNPSIVLLVTKNKLYFRPPVPSLFHDAIPPEMSKITSQTFRPTDNVVFDAPGWVQASGILLLKPFVQLLIYPLTVLNFFGFYSVILLVLAFLGQLVAKLFYGLRLTFKESSRLLVVGATPQVFFMFLCFTLNYLFPTLGLYSLVLLTVYYCYALLSLKRESKKMVVR